MTNHVKIAISDDLIQKYRETRHAMDEYHDRDEPWPDDLKRDLAMITGAIAMLVDNEIRRNEGVPF